jgi:hypothetical protein
MEAIKSDLRFVAVLEAYTQMHEKLPVDLAGC